jgi:hypothetical protein
VRERSIHASYDAYLDKVMRSIYNKAAQIKGSGAPAKRAALIEREVTKVDGVWLKVHDTMESAFNELFKRLENNIVERFAEVFDSIHQDFLTLCSDTETKDEKQKIAEDLLREELKGNLAEVKKMVDDGGEISKLVAQCKAHSAQANVNATASSSLAKSE